MATKQLLPNQHTPLHLVYGQHDCCLCRAEKESHLQKVEIDLLKSAIEQFASIVTNVNVLEDELTLPTLLLTLKRAGMAEIADGIAVSSFASAIGE